MNKYDIQPTTSNLASSIKNDVTGRNRNLYNLVRPLNFQEDSWSIAINGKWGTGKTFFIKQCQLILDNAFTCENEEIRQAINVLCPNDKHDIRQTHFRTAYYDAWEHDSEEDPIASLIRCLTSTDWSMSVKETLEKAINIGIKILNATTHVDLSDLYKTLNGKSEKSDTIDALRKQFNEVLAKLAPQEGKLIIFIDELDRCKPTYAVKLLERIKHYFSNPNVTFIFAIDLGQLQYTINQYYGSQFNGYQYLDRFFDLVVSLPEPDIDKYFNNTQNILEAAQHFNKLDPKNSNYYRFCKELIDHFSFSIRQINHFYLKTNSATYNLLDHILNPQGLASPPERHGKFIIYDFLLPLMCALSQANINEYTKFISGNASKETLSILANSKEFTNFYKEMLSNKSDIDFFKGVSEIYNSIFDDQKSMYLRISDQCVIEYPSQYKKQLIDASSLLSPEVKFN